MLHPERMITVFKIIVDGKPTQDLSITIIIKYFVYFRNSNNLHSRPNEGGRLHRNGWVNGRAFRVPRASSLLGIQHLRATVLRVRVAGNLRVCSRKFFVLVYHI